MTILFCSTLLRMSIIQNFSVMYFVWLFYPYLGDVMNSRVKGLVHFSKKFC